MYSTKKLPKPCKPVDRPPLTSSRLLDRVRERIRSKHHSIRTESSYVQWIRRFIRFNGMRHPRDMGAREVVAFLSWLAAAREVPPSTHGQALSAILFLYREVLEAGYDIRIIQELLGHADVSTTMIYTHVLNKGGRGVVSSIDRMESPAAREPRAEYVVTA